MYIRSERYIPHLTPNHHRRRNQPMATHRHRGRPRHDTHSPIAGRIVPAENRPGAAPHAGNADGGPHAGPAPSILAMRLPGNSGPGGRSLTPPEVIDLVRFRAAEALDQTEANLDGDTDLGLFAC